MRKLLCISVATVLFACHAAKPLVSSVDSTATKVTIQYQEKIKDSLVFIPADSSWLTALLACDSNGNVLLKQLESYNAGMNLKPPSFVLKNNHLTTGCNVDSSIVYLRWKERYERTDSGILKSKSVTITLPPQRINYVTWWQRLFITSGKTAWILLLLAGLYMLIKSRLKLPLKLNK